MNLVLGVDPGLRGALAVYDPLHRSLIALCAMETHTPHRKVELDLSALALFLQAYASDIRLAVIEDVHAMPKQGVVSTFRFGEALGIIEGMVGSFLIPIKKVSPAVWKARFGLDRDKTKSRKMAAELFPARSFQFERAKDDGNAEAALLAVFGGLYF